MTQNEQRQKRWRLILGGGEADGIGCTLSGMEQGIDNCLTAVYGDGANGGGRRGSLGGSAPNVTRWLGDIRQYFPSSVVRVIQQDAIERLGLRQLLLEPEVLQAVEADIHLVATLISLKNVIPTKTKDTARQVVNKVVEDLLRRLQQPMQQAVKGALNRAVRNNRPRLQEIDWNRTIRANIKNYLPEYNTIVPDKLIGYGRKRSALKEVVLCIDQSGSMAPSVVYSSIFAAVMASIPALSTKMVVFDTSIVDLTEELHDDPVDLLFGLQLGGGTDINRAIAYCQSLISRPDDTVFILISDLYEGGNANEMLKRTAQLVASGVQVISLLALSDEGAPFYDHDMAAKFATLGVPTFACTPDQFPELMANALMKQDLGQWAAKQGIVVQQGR
ncbi:MAG TPA: VWA domain-containing protein [Candidatus Thiothrix moscowensis]|uniref:VWA domain-containing protein n=1 Tax=unclassified Thiothrix TaxID=2636184 RepID=UPI0025F7C341|nr:MULTISPECIES: VWA domain-containing protein [unclassified Thiothrix]HRJ52093.1 VWA domain-containing protein [Candidatus Thiothrix moscowensis]HRJ92396.1 VWA domain-containing protein [Candidatus Thiothrix moscowensis]